MSAAFERYKAMCDYYDPNDRTPEERELIRQADIRYGQKTITENIEYVKFYLKYPQTSDTIRSILHHTRKLMDFYESICYWRGVDIGKRVDRICARSAYRLHDYFPDRMTEMEELFLEVKTCWETFNTSKGMRSGEFFKFAKYSAWWKENKPEETAGGAGGMNK